MRSYEILIVDTDTSILKTVSSTLKMEGHKVTTARSGEEAFELLAEKDFDLVLTGLVMDPFDGFNILRKAKEINPEILVMIMNGFDDLNSAIEAIRNDADDYLIKPCTPEEISLRVSHCLNKLERRRKARQSQKELTENGRYLRSLLSSVREDIVVIDSDFRITDINGAFLPISGFECQDVIGRHCFEVLHGLDKPCRKPGVKSRDVFEFHCFDSFHNYTQENKKKSEECLLKKVFKTGKGQSCRHEHLRSDGSKFWVDILLSPLKDEADNITHVMMAARDITDLVNAEETLYRSTEKYQLLVENANDAIFVIQDGVIKFPNPKTEEMTGYYAEELGKILFHDFVHQEDREMVEQRYKRVLEGEEFHSPCSFRIMNIVGKELWVEINEVHITWEGRPATLNFLRDITEKRKQEVRLQEAQRLGVIGTLAGGIAHDFNNLLMGILGHTSLMLFDTGPSHPHFDHLKKIEKCVESGADLTKKLLGFARGGKYEVKPTDLNEMIRKNSKIFGRTNKNIRIRRKYQKEIWTVEIDQNQIDQVLLSLYVNASQAMPDGGNLYIKTKNVEFDENEVLVTEAKPGKYVRITVADTGIGMDDETQQRIFEPFFTTRERGWGTGLGLASVYGIITNHNGIINVESEKGEGTVFSVYLPVSEKGAT